MNMKIWIALFTAWILPESVIAQGNQLGNAPPTFCEIKQSTWCILYSDVTYKDVPSGIKGFASSWIIRGGTWKDHPLVINEPVGCRNGKSDTLEFMSSDKNIKFMNEYFDKVTVKIKKDGSCNLEIMYPRLGEDPQDGAFFAGMTLIKACSNAACDGNPIGLKIRSYLRR